MNIIVKGHEYDNVECDICHKEVNAVARLYDELHVTPIDQPGIKHGLEAEVAVTIDTCYNCLLHAITLLRAVP